jgi:hypothetical protein
MALRIKADGPKNSLDLQAGLWPQSLTERVFLQIFQQLHTVNHDVESFLHPSVFGTFAARTALCAPLFYPFLKPGMRFSEDIYGFGMKAQHVGTME